MSNRAPHLQVGQTGEETAVEYLQNKGFEILERNYRKKWGEIDIVTKYKNVLRFIEVKTSRYGSIGISPEENVHSKKKQRLARAIQTYLIERKISESQEFQVDVLVIHLDNLTERTTIEHIENVIFE